jgi:N utilization substance protein A
MASLIGQSIDMLCSEQGLDREMVIEAMKDAVKAAARKQFKAQDKTGDSIQVEWNAEDGEIEVSALKTVVEDVENPSAELSLVEAQEMAGDEVEIGDMLQIPLSREEMGRIAAQTAKQILVQKVREAIREKVYDEYVDRKGELINGTVKRFERGDMIIDLGANLEAILPRREQSRGEVWNQGERIRVVIVDVTKDQKGQQIRVSRASAELIKRLFEMEVPEIYDDTVVIKSAVREPGDRAKIAVASNEKDVDPVGACVGMKGSRVQSIIKELRGEKIDIIEWSDEPSVFAANALSPAKVSQVRITDINKRKMEVIVAEDQLSLAIGKKGQNVRLATRLVGWDIDIVSEEVLKKEIAQQMGRMIASGEAVPLTALQGVSANQAELLAEKDVTDVEALAAMSVDDLVDTAAWRCRPGAGPRRGPPRACRG